MSIDVTRTAGIATVTVNAPERLNALNSERLVELDAAFAALGKDETVRAVIFTGSGERACRARAWRAAC